MGRYGYHASYGAGRSGFSSGYGQCGSVGRDFRGYQLNGLFRFVNVMKRVRIQMFSSMRYFQGRR